MNRSNLPTAYWVIRESDGVPFTLLASRSAAELKKQYYERDTGESFRVSTEHRKEIAYRELPETWEEDWPDRVPYSVRVVDVPEYAAP